MYQVPPSHPRPYSAPSVALQPISLSQILNETFRLYRSNFLLFFSITLLLALPTLLFNLYLNYYLVTSFLVDFNSQMEEILRQVRRGGNLSFETLLPFITPIARFALFSLFVSYLDFIVLRSLAVAATTIAIQDVYTGLTPALGKAFGFAFRRLGELVIWGILLSIIIIGPLLLLIIPTALLVLSDNANIALVFCFFLPILPAIIAFLSIRLIFGSRAIVVENVGPAGAWRRSWQLTQGSFWRILGFWIVIIMLVTVISLIGLIIQPIVSIIVVDPIALQLISAVISSLVGAATMPIYYISITLLFFDQQRLLEGGNIQPRPGAPPSYAQ